MGFGLVSVDSHPRECRLARVRVNGVDVTARCFLADDERGFVDCFKVDEFGRKYLVDHRSAVATERLYGGVVIDFPRGLE